MKNIALVIVIALAKIISSPAQTLYVPSGTGGIGSSATGNIGIGSISPMQKFEVNGSIFQFSENAAFGIDAQPNARLGIIKKYGNGPVIASDATFPIIFSQSNQNGIFTNISGATITERMRIETNGNVGIGTNNPTQKLDVNGIINASGIYINNQPFAGGGSQWTTSASDVYYNAGNVGIGTTSTGSFKLAVEGKIGAREVNVLASGWPDYVFENNYNLPTLAELEAFIKINKHLPEVPSACVVEENGVNLGEMNKVLLKKVEELTLYVIELKKEVDALKLHGKAK